MNKTDKKWGSPGGGHFARMFRVTMKTSAWRALSTTAKALYPCLLLEWHGPKNNNNGRIRFSVKQAAEMLRVAPNTAAKAFHELQAQGFIVVREQACLGIAGAGKGPAFELTEHPMPGGREGQKLYKQWSEGNDFEVVRARANNPTGKNGKTKSLRIFEDETVIEFETHPRKQSQFG